MLKKILLVLISIITITGCASKQPVIREYTIRWGQSALALDDIRLSELVLKYGQPDEERKNRYGVTYRAIYHRQFDNEEVALWLNTYAPQRRYDVEIVRTDFVFKQGYIEQFLFKYKYPILVKSINGKSIYMVLEKDKINSGK